MVRFIVSIVTKQGPKGSKYVEDIEDGVCKQCGTFVVVAMVDISYITL